MTAPVPAAGETAAGMSRTSTARPSESGRSAPGPAALTPLGDGAVGDVDNPRSPILAGFLGSLFMTIG